jgi:hypothetical protein
MPISELAITICPVDDTGKNSVNPSIIARMITCIMFIVDRLMGGIRLTGLIVNRLNPFIKIN